MKFSIFRATCTQRRRIRKKKWNFRRMEICICIDFIVDYCISDIASNSSPILVVVVKEEISEGHEYV